MKFKKNYLLPVILLSGILATYGASYMLKNTFWGHTPLYLLLGSWLVLSLSVFWKYQSTNEHLLYFLLSTASGLILGKAFVYTSPLLCIGFIPLLYATYKLEQGSRIFMWAHFLYAFHAFMLWNILATYWVANAALVPGLVAFILNSLFMCIPWLAAIWIGRKIKYLWLPALIVFWISYEWGHHQWDISWPWLSLGNGFAFYPNWIQWYEYTGAFGGSLWALSLNALGLYILISKKLRLILCFSAMLLLGIPIYISSSILKTTELNGESVEVAIVQPNYEPHFEKFSVDENLQMIQFEKLSRNFISPHTKYLIWPETSFEYLEIGAFANDWRVIRMRDLCNMYGKMCLVTGLGTLRTFREGETLSEAARPSNRGGPTKYFEIQNSAAQICGTGNDFPVYVKSKLVPGVETFPYRHLLPFLKPIVDKLGGSIYGLGKQKERSVFESDGLKIAPVICYESIYGAYVGEYIRKGAQAIFIMTNDGWWDNTPGYRQHLYFGALRAIEYRRSIARSANTGVSCFIDAKGEIKDRTEYGKSTAIRNNIRFSNQETFYLKYGDFIVYIALALSFLILMLGFGAILKVRFLKNQ
ncbi:MAG: apolipoprotein N-acyltransferase [Saprospiraceae bacterium]|nr:apolipoprotein N-acyltransferase [Saprospiraceae bacterium]